jgi:ligand-binding SRPBCC domain-containing protein
MELPVAREKMFRHRFLVSAGGTRIEDEVIDELPWGGMGSLAAPLVRRQLDKTFAYRGQAIIRCFQEGV